MFGAARFVVVDDNAEHLSAIVRSLRALGAHSQGIIWDPLKNLEPRDFRRVRGLFLDLQLLENIATTDYKRHYANIQTILEDCISQTGGPFVVILWTSAGDKAEELRKYLLKNIPDEAAYARPIAVIPLPKNEYISLVDGVELAGTDLIGAVKEGLASLPAFASLMQWEFEVQEASSVVLSHLLGTEFLRGDDEDRGQRVADYLLRLAGEAVGVSNVEGSERVAIHSALLPLLSDEIQNAAPEASDSAQWSRTFSDRSGTSAKLSVTEAAALNSRMHLASPAGNGIVPSEWGAMTLLPRGFFWPLVGHPNRLSWLEKSLNLKPALPDGDMSKVKVYKVRVGAACDYAQRRRAPVPFALCAAVPAKTGSTQRSLNATSNNWLSPLLLMDSVPYQLVIDPSMVFTQQPEIANIGNATYRLREQILMEIVNKISGYGSRPGMIRFNA